MAKVGNPRGGGRKQKRQHIRPEAVFILTSMDPPTERKPTFPTSIGLIGGAGVAAAAASSRFALQHDLEWNHDLATDPVTEL